MWENVDLYIKQVLQGTRTQALDMAIQVDKIFLCTNKERMLTIIFSCYNQKPRIWKVIQNLQKHKIRLIQGKTLNIPTLYN